MGSGFDKDPEFFVISGYGADQGFTEDEAYALLAGLDNTSSTAIMPLIAAAEANDDEEEHTGAMVALVPSDADIKRLAVKGGEAADQLHLTLMFLGEADDISPNARKSIIETVEKYADNPLVAQGFSVNVFNPQASNSCIVLGVGNDDGSLEALHSNVTSALGGLAGLNIPEQHSPWIPHITLQYTDEFDDIETLSSRTGPVTFDKIRVAFGGEAHDIPLGEALTAAFWREKDHPRNEDGEFTEKAGAAASTPDSVRNVTPLEYGGIGIRRSKAPDTKYAGAVNVYMSGAFKPINEGLREHKGNVKKVKGTGTETQVLGTRNLQDTVSSLDQAMNASKLTEDVHVTRGISDPQKVFGKAWGKDLTGVTWTDHGFVSTSPEAGYAASYAVGAGKRDISADDSVIMNILVPKGTGALYVQENLDDNTVHHELVLDRGLRYRVVKDHGIIKGARTLDVEVY